MLSFAVQLALGGIIYMLLNPTPVPVNIHYYNLIPILGSSPGIFIFSISCIKINLAAKWRLKLFHIYSWLHIVHQLLLSCTWKRRLTNVFLKILSDHKCIFIIVLFPLLLLSYHPTWASFVHPLFKKLTSQNTVKNILPPNLTKSDRILLSNQTVIFFYIWISQYFLSGIL